MPIPKKKKGLDHSQDEGLETPDEELEEDQSPEELEEEEESSQESEETDETSTGKKKQKGKKASVEDETEEEIEEGEEETQEEDTGEEEDLFPEDASPEERKRLQKIADRMKSGLNKKMTLMDKKYKGKKVIGDFGELLKDPEFMNWARQQMGETITATGDVSRMSVDEAIQNWTNLTDGQRRQFYTALKPEQRGLFKVQLQMAQVSQNILNSRETEMENKVVERWGDIYNERKSDVAKLRKDVQMNPYLTHEEAFKIVDYDNARKRAFMAGIKKGKKNVKEIKDLPRSSVGSSSKGKKPRAKTLAEAYEQAEDEEV